MAKRFGSVGTMLCTGAYMFTRRLTCYMYMEETRFPRTCSPGLIMSLGSVGIAKLLGGLRGRRLQGPGHTRRLNERPWAMAEGSKRPSSDGAPR